jgi:predicted branched-subunit amino acid permease
VNRATAAQSLSVSLTVGAYGIAFGAASVAAGFSVLQSCLLSLLTFTGASQFAVIGVLGAGGSALSGIATASLLGVRNTLYGLRMAPILQVKGLRRIFAAQITIDESTGVALSQEHLGVKAARQGFWLTGIGVFIFWNIFTLAGALGAQAMGNPAAWGLDAAVPAAFLGLTAFSSSAGGGRFGAWCSRASTSSLFLAPLGMQPAAAVAPLRAGKAA